MIIRVLSNPIQWRGVGLALCLLVLACVPTPPGGLARDANTEVPDGFGGENPVGESAALVSWRDFFGDPNLAALIDVALENNQELAIAVQETLVANSEIIARRGEYLPRMGVGIGAGVDGVGEHTSQGASDEQAGLPKTLQSYSIGLYASWEIDIWRRLRNLGDAAVYRYLASVEGRNFTVTRLVAEIARLYYELVALDLQLEVIDSSVELQESALEAVRLQQQAARVTSLAVNRFEAQLRNFQSRQFELRQAIVETENRINFLVGRFPQHVARRTEGFLEQEPAAVSTGLPAALLENRPDVRMAELELSAAELDVKAARARFYPALSIEAGVGYQSYDIRQLLATPSSLIYSLFANLTAPLLNRNDIKADYFGANAEQMQAVLRYERSILNAHIEVVNGVQRIQNLAEAFELKQQRVDRLTESIEISNQLFFSARADYLEVLTTRRDALEAQIELIETKRDQMTATVSLYQALGGGWRPLEESADDEASPRERD